jgi:hypothetical protein
MAGRDRPVGCADLEGGTRRARVGHGQVGVAVEPGLADLVADLDLGQADVDPGATVGGEGVSSLRA